jgi:hypothetical protein
VPPTNPLGTEEPCPQRKIRSKVTLAGIFTAFLSAFVAAGLTALLGFWRSHSKRWWEKKYEAYASIINALHHMSRLYNESFHALNYQNGVIIDRKIDPLRQKTEDGRAEILRLSDVVEFVVSSTTIIELRSLLKTLAVGQKSNFDSLLTESNAVEDCLERVLQLAKEDLNPSIARRFWGYFRSRQYRGDPPKA